MKEYVGVFCVCFSRCSRFFFLPMGPVDSFCGPVDLSCRRARLTLHPVSLSLVAKMGTTDVSLYTAGKGKLAAFVFGGEA